MMCSMMTLKIAAATAVALLLGGSVTQPTPNNLDLDLPAAVQGVVESPALIRIGVVDAIVESDNITVKISGSPVLVTASYLFPQYQPLLGDRVYVIKQDAQWFVLGTMAGPINTQLANASFEEGVIGALPTGWTINVIASGGGVPTFTKVTAIANPLAGQFYADFGTDSVAAGLSQADVFSPTVPAEASQSWTSAFFVSASLIDQQNGGLNTGSGNSNITMNIQFLDGGGAVLSDTYMGGITANGPGRTVYIRPDADVPPAVAPVGTVEVRLRINGIFQMSANAFSSFFIDYMILRQVS